MTTSRTEPHAPFRSLNPADRTGKAITYHAGLWTLPGSSTNRRGCLYGLERIWNRAIATERAEELWFWHCTACPGPDTPAGEAAMMAAIERRAAGAPGWHTATAPGAD